MNYVIITPEIVTTAIATLVFGFLLILSALRLRSREQVAFHLFLFMGLGFLLSLLVLVDLLHFTSLSSLLTIRFTGLTQLAMILTFGALTLNFLRKVRKALLQYWIIALIVLLIWCLFAFDFLGWNRSTVSPSISP